MKSLRLRAVSPPSHERVLEEQPSRASRFRHRRGRGQDGLGTAGELLGERLGEVREGTPGEPILVPRRAHARETRRQEFDDRVVVTVDRRSNKQI